jgi:hypothetical protein
VLGAGVSLPTGSTTQKGATLVSSSSILPYNMQLGTGTTNLLPSLVYTCQKERITFGAAVQANIKLGMNARNYAFGNEYSLSPWLACKIASWISLSLRAEAYYQSALYGYDADINNSSGNDPSANVYNYGSRKIVNCLGGMNIRIPKTWLQNMQLLLEYGKPVYQNLGGISAPGSVETQRFQMPLQSVFNARLQYNF